MIFAIVDHMKLLGIIPARGGSKRLPGKNKKEFLGRSLVERTVDGALASGVFDKLIVLTDDMEIAELGERAGADVPFLEPAELATDTSYIFDGVRYTLERLRREQGYTTPWFMLLEPTSPGRQVRHIHEVAEIISRHDDIDSVAGVSETPGLFHPIRALAMGSDFSLVRHDGELLKNVIRRTQEAPKSYYINGVVYAFKTQNLFSESPSLWGERVYGYFVDQKYAMDIDTHEDWVVAEAKMQHLLADTTGELV